MIWLPDSYLNLLIEEDLYLIDLTSTSLELNKYSGQLLAQAKKETMVAGVEAAARMFELAGVKAQILVHSGKIAKAGETLLKLEGRADRLHAVYKAAQNLMEYSSSIAQRCHKMLTKARLGNPKVELAVTRKHFPGTKRLSLSAALAGGATVHRQGLSDSVLVFDQHREFLGGFEEFLKFIPLLKERNLEKKIAVEIS
ncbi:MAG: ModD protein, partial [Deltaproteobacteria bacterium]|nr:ModD protein [Deltaproteobacteria bacterium]